MQYVHLDTDLGGDTDDLCALALLLAWPDVEITGITTCLEAGGRRAGYVSEALKLAKRTGIPVAAGAEGGLMGLHQVPDYPDEGAMWPEPVPPRPGRPGEALDLLNASIERGATIIGIGPYTNLALYEAARPGRLSGVPVVLMGGSLGPLPSGLPDWGPELDWNMYEDAAAAQRVFESCAPTLVPVAATLQTHLCLGDLPSLERAGPLSALLARQARVHAEANQMPALGKRYPGLPDDLLNFQHDALTCAVALGWSGARVEELRLRFGLHQGRWPVFRPEADGKPVQVVTSVDGAAFRLDWLNLVTGSE